MKRMILIVLFGLTMQTYIQAQVPTRLEFLKVCDSLGVHHPNVVYAQARLESGNFTSAHYRNRHNCLGIYDSKRKRYASFESWQDCVKAYRDRVQYRCKTPNCTDEEYIQWLIKIGYAQDKTYASKIRRMMKQ